MRGRSPAAQRAKAIGLAAPVSLKAMSRRPAGGEQPFGPEPHDGIRALLQIARADVDVDDGHVHVLAGLRRTGVEQHGRARRA